MGGIKFNKNYQEYDRLSNMKKLDKRNLKILLACCLFFFSSHTTVDSQSVEHLEPLDRTFDVLKKSSAAITKISEALRIERYMPTLRYIAVPSFSETVFLDLYFDKEKCYLIYLEGDEILKIEIDPISAGMMKSLFSVAIHETRYDKEPVTSFVLDGTRFFFFLKEEHATKGGQTWSPYKNTLMWKLITISNEFIGLAKTEEVVVFDEDLVKRIEELNKELIQCCPCK